MATKQKSGLYRAKVKLGNDKDGKPVYKYISGRTKRELEEARREVQEHYIDGIGIVHDVLLSVYMQKWYDTYKKNVIGPSTKRCYANAMNNHIIPEMGNRMMRSITATDIQHYMNSLAGMSMGTINISITILKGVFASAVRDRIISVNVAAYIVPPIASKQKEKYVLSDKERAAIERVCETHEHGLMLSILYYTGMRLGEMLGLQWQDIDLANNMIHVQRNANSTTHKIAKLKTRASDRFIPIPEQLSDRLRSIPRGLPTMQLFPGKNGNPITSVWYYVVFDHQMAQCNLKGKVTPHTLRHNYLTMCYESGIDPYTASRLAGHSNINTTMNTYTHLSNTHLKTISTQVNGMFNNGCKKVAQEK